MTHYNLPVTPLETVHEYYAAFSTLDMNAIASHFSEPTMTISPQGVASAANQAAVALFMGPLIEGLRKKGYGRSEFAEARLTMLGESDALVQGIAVRYTAAGAEMERVPLAYLMHRSEAGWKIAVLLARA